MSHGHIEGRAATRVIMRPKSGRRHQLRIHALGLGYPIVGDATYNDSDNCDNHADNIMPRMMLHAWRLVLPLESGTRTVEAPDPFTNLFSALSQDNTTDSG